MIERNIDKQTPFISVIIPVYQEEKYIEQFIVCLCNQTYSYEKTEYIFIDGMSKDFTRQHIRRFMVENPSKKIKLLDNKKQYQVNALNIGINASEGDIIIRLDVHSKFPDNYIELCVKTLLETGADNVGGLAITKGTNRFSNVAAKLLSSKFGVGNSGFRTNADSGFVETVPFGTFRKELFNRIGLFDERLIRNEDNEFNARIIKNGGKIYLNNNIRFEYFCRDSFISLMNMAYKNGIWNIITSKLIKGSMSLRHFIPLLFFIFFLFGLVITIFFPVFFHFWATIIGIYAIIDVITSVKLSESIMECLYLLLLFPSFHLVYGLGSFVGIFKAMAREY